MLIAHILSGLVLTAVTSNSVILNEKGDLNPQQEWHLNITTNEMVEICSGYFGTCLGVLGDSLVEHMNVLLYEKDLGDKYNHNKWKLDPLIPTTIQLNGTNFAIDIFSDDPKLLWIYSVKDGNDGSDKFQIIQE